MGYWEQHAARNYNKLRGQVAECLYDLGREIIARGEGPPERLNLAVSCVQAPDTNVDPFVRAVVRDEQIEQTIQAGNDGAVHYMNAPDERIRQVCQAVWDDVAGATTG